jgi:cell division protein FtsZ
MGQKAAEASREEIAKAIGNADLVFIVAGMGKGTGTGTAPIIAEVAKEMGALSVGVVSRPFTNEGHRRCSKAEEGIAALESRVDTLVVVRLNKLLSAISEQTPIQEAFKVADDILRPGSARISIGVGSGVSRARDAAMTAIYSPLLDFSIEGAKDVIIKITSGSDFTSSELNAAVETISEVVDPSANIIFDIVVDDKMQGEVRIIVIAAGIAAECSRDVELTPALMKALRQRKPRE